MIGTLIISVVLLLFFWQSILTFLLTTFIPWLLKTLGPIASDIFKKIVAFLDKTVTWTRLQIRKAWAWFKTRIAGMETVYDLSDPSKIIRITTSYIVSEEGNIIKQVSSEEVDYDTLPADVRAEFIKINQEKVAVDVKDQIEKKFKERIKEQENVSDQEVLEILV